MAVLGNTFYNQRFGTKLNGTDDIGDTINGFGGNDVIYAGKGNDYVYGGAGDDELYAGKEGSWTHDFWGHDTVFGGDGNDWINYYYSADNVTIYGDHRSYEDAVADGTYADGNDTIYGSWSLDGDHLQGGGGNDTIYGQRGNDTIHGDYGAVLSPGLIGNDTIDGGEGADYITTGQGRDTIVIKSGESGVVRGGSDLIADFDGINDKIDLPRGVLGGATSSNYYEGGVYSGGFDSALSLANAHLDEVDYAFITDGKNGYLFADSNGDSRADIGVTLLGLDSLSDFNWSHII